jgi:hypothetical protein
LAREWRPGFGGADPSPVLGAYAYQTVPDLGEIGASSALRSGAGWMRVQLGDPRINFLYAGATSDPQQPNAPNLLVGLPAIGFRASNYQADGPQGLLANYAMFAPHSGGQALKTAVVTIAEDGSVSWQAVQP